MMTFSPPTTHSKGKAKVSKSVWEDPATALGRAQNVITDDELKGLLSIPSHELVSHHIHKLVQVFYLAILHYSLSIYIYLKFLVRTYVIHMLRTYVNIYVIG